MQKIKTKNMNKEKELKWGTIIPLIGGSAIGCNKLLGIYQHFI